MKKTKLIVKTKSKIYPIIIGSNILKNTSSILKSNNISFNKFHYYSFIIVFIINFSLLHSLQKKYISLYFDVSVEHFLVLHPKTYE